MSWWASCGAVAGWPVIACLGGCYPTQSLQSCALSIYVVQGWGWNDCSVCFGSCGQIGVAIGAEQERENNAFLQDDFIGDNEFKLILLTLMPLGPIFLHPLLFSLWGRDASVLRQPVYGLVNEVAWRVRSCTVVLIFDLQNGHILWQIDSDDPPWKFLWVHTHHILCGIETTCSKVPLRTL